MFILTSPSDNEPTVEAFFEGSYPVYDGANEQYSSQRITIREIQGSNANTAAGAFIAKDWLIANDAEVANAANLSTNLANLGLENLIHPMVITEGTLVGSSDIELVFSDGTNTLTIDTDGTGDSSANATLGLNPAAGDGLEAIKDEILTITDLKGFSFTFLNDDGEVFYRTTAYDDQGNESVAWNSSGIELIDNTANVTGSTTIDSMIVGRDDMTNFSVDTSDAAAQFAVSISGENNSSPADINAAALDADLTTTSLSSSSIDWVDEKDPPVKVGYDDINQRLTFEVDRTVLGSGTDSNFNSFSVYGSASQTGINNLGLTNADNAPRVQIRGGEILHGEPFVATGEEIQPNDKRYGIKSNIILNFRTLVSQAEQQVKISPLMGLLELPLSKKHQIFRLVAMP